MINEFINWVLYVPGNAKLPIHIIIMLWLFIPFLVFSEFTISPHRHRSLIKRIILSLLFGGYINIALLWVVFAADKPFYISYALIIPIIVGAIIINWKTIKDCIKE